MRTKKNFTMLAHVLSISRHLWKKPSFLFHYLTYSDSLMPTPQSLNTNSYEPLHCFKQEANICCWLAHRLSLSDPHILHILGVQLLDDGLSDHVAVEKKKLFA